MQQHDALRRQFVDGRQHAGKVEASGGRVVIGVGLDLESCAFKDRAVVVPGRIRHMDRAGREIALDEISANLQAAARADALDRHRTCQHRVGRAEQQRLHSAAEIGSAFHRQIGPGAGIGHHGELGLAYRIEHRDASGIIEIDADRQIDLVLPGVVLEVLVEAQDRIAGIGVDMFEHSGNSGDGGLRLTPLSAPRPVRSSAPPRCPGGVFRAHHSAHSA